MKKFKFLFLIALVATMFIGCAQPTDDIACAQPTVKESKSFQIFEGVVLLYKDASVTYSDGRVDKYKITTIPMGFTAEGDNYQKTCTIKSQPKSTIDFFNGTPIIISMDEVNGDANKKIRVELKFFEIYTKVE